jgi:HD-GYP domain-containing protein (c-di-GMP phosphodiesterase class II)
LIRKHPEIGYDLLYDDITLPINKRCLDSVLQHHENCDGSGYPKSRKIFDIDQIARVLRITDSYEAMTAKRRWRDPRTPKEALWTILDQCKSAQIYDPHYFKEFVTFLTK